MKKLDLFAILVLVATVSGCSKEPLPQHDADIRLELSGRMAARQTETGEQTLPLEEHAELGVYLVNCTTQEDLPTGTCSNGRYTVDASGGINGDAPVLIPGHTYDVYAYLPHKPDCSDPSRIPFVHGEDIRFADQRTLENVQADNCRAELLFRHCAAQLGFEVTAAPDFADKELLAQATLEVTGFYPGGTVDISTCTLTPSGEPSTPGSGARITDPTGTAACFVPVDGDMTLTVRVSLNGRTYTTTLTRNFQPGVSVRYTVELQNPEEEEPDPLHLTFAEVPWQDQAWEDPVGEYDLCEPANTFMVLPGESIRFDPYKGGDGLPNPHIAPGNIASMDILWQTRNAATDDQFVLGDASSIYLHDGVVTVRTNRMARGGGNAVVAARDANGVILWSWQLWVTDYAPKPNGIVDNRPEYRTQRYEGVSWTDPDRGRYYGRVIMDRNLGATIGLTAPPTDVKEAARAFGMLYQWGRKDPFPVGNGTAMVEAGASGIVRIYDATGTELTEGAGTIGTGIKKMRVSVINNLANAIANPLVYYFTASYPGIYDWYTNGTIANQNGKLWREEYKTIYDPCPAGWRVPTVLNKTLNAFNVYGLPWSGFGDGDPASMDDGVDSPAGLTPFVKSGDGLTLGRLYTAGGVNAWYPAPGVRDYLAGDFGDRGSYYATAFANSSDKSNVGLFVYADDPQAYNLPSRAIGQFVRCVQDE